AVRSAERLVDKAPSCLAVGHGHFLASPEQSMKLAIQKAKKGV
ncbi:MBL fold metallo-hydrolase, partial [Bacillus mojavensis]|nr:MBL fold metallo-hydrolase [Bacillus mojavensis]